MDLETGAGKVLPVYIEEEMQKSYIDYAMSVIVQRARHAGSWHGFQQAV